MTRKPRITFRFAVYGTIGLVTYIVFFCLLLAFKVEAHSWYRSTKDPETGLSCCGGRDCKSVPKESIEIDKEGGGYRYLQTGELIPWSRAQQSHDFEFHRCEYMYDINNAQGSYKKGDTRCFFVPGGTG
jgi:hypothetical protein